MRKSIEKKRSEAIDELKRIASLLGQNFLSQRQFNEQSELKARTVKEWFGNWTNALNAAGLEKVPSANSGPQISELELLTALNDWREEHGDYPTISMWNAEGKYSSKPYRDRWGSWTKAIEAAKSRQFASSPDAPVVFPSLNKITTDPAKPAAVSQSPTSVEQRGRSIQYGAPISFRGLRHEPINEQGVVYLFGMVSSELGFLIEAIRTAFPDCEGKRRVDAHRNRWESVKIEFEYKSRNFLTHGHNVEDCDVIVCWEHDWEECPLEVIELKSVIRSLSNQSR